MWAPSESSTGGHPLLLGNNAVDQKCFALWFLPHHLSLYPNMHHQIGSWKQVPQLEPPNRAIGPLLKALSSSASLKDFLFSSGTLEVLFPPNASSWSPPRTLRETLHVRSPEGLLGTGHSAQAGTHRRGDTTVDWFLPSQNQSPEWTFKAPGRE